jgi:CubicO group peptidase (beta-lactamase class C family)
MPFRAHRTAFTIACFFLLLLASSTRAHTDHALTTRLDEVILRSELGQFWGAVLIAQDGKPILAKGYGLANDSLAPIDSRTLFDIGSVAKQFTAALALKLHVEKQLSLDEPITKYFADLPPAAGGVTLRHLLTHTSGLSDANGAIQQLDFADRDEAVRLAFRSRLSSKPGERFEYCNGGYCVAAAIIERAIGGPFQALMREEIFKPAGLANTGFLDGDGLDLSNASARIVSGRGGGSRRSILQDGWGWGLRGCGGILMSLDDIHRWDAALRGDQLFDDGAKRQLYAPMLENYALGWMVEPAASGAMKVSHSGGTRGYRSYLLRIPDQGIVIAVLTNDRHDPVGLGTSLLTALLPEERTEIEGTLNITGLTLNEHKLAEIDKDVRIHVDGHVPMPDVRPTPFDLRVEVPIAGGGGRTDAVKLVMMPGQARQTAASIRAALQSKPAGQRTTSGINAIVATMPYTPEGGVIRLPPDVKLIVMPRYSGTGRDGRPVIDERICIVLTDEANGFWPVILKLDRPSAEELAGRLDPGPHP